MNDARRTEIVTALRALRDVSEVLQRGDAGGRFEPGSKLLEMPAAYRHGVFPHLVRRLDEIHKLYPEHYRHLSARYIVSERAARYIVTVGKQHFEAVAYTAFAGGVPETRYYAGERLPSNAEVLPGARYELTKVVRRQPGQVAPKLFRAIVERWDEAVEMRKVGRCLDFLSFWLPRRIEMPRDRELVA